MGTKTTTNSSGTQDSNQKTTFDPGSMQRYQSWGNQMFGQLGNMFQNPLGSPFFNQNMQASSRAATSLAGRNMSNSMLNYGRSGIGAGSMFGGARNALLSQLGRYSSGMQFQGFNNAVNNAQTNMWNAGQLGSSLFQPLQTGGTFHGTNSNTQTQSTGGLGTWLPQLAGAALGAATGGLGGAVGGIGKMISNVGGSAANSAMNNSLGSGGVFSGGQNFFQPTAFPGASSPGTGASYNPFMPGGGV